MKARGSHLATKETSKLFRHGEVGDNHPGLPQMGWEQVRLPPSALLLCLLFPTETEERKRQIVQIGAWGLHCVGLEKMASWSASRADGSRGLLHKRPSALGREWKYSPGLVLGCLGGGFPAVSPLRISPAGASTLGLSVGPVNKGSWWSSFSHGVSGASLPS